MAIVVRLFCGYSLQSRALLYQLYNCIIRKTATTKLANEPDRWTATSRMDGQFYPSKPNLQRSRRSLLVDGCGMP